MSFIFKALHDYHDHRYVLTVPNNTGRQASIKRELRGWDLDFFMGVDKHDVTKEKFIADGVYDEIRARKLDRRSKPMTRGEVCCSLGHRFIYEDMLKNGFEKVMIFEDDAYALPEAEPFLEKMIEQIPEDAEMIYWGWQGLEKPPPLAFFKQALYHLQHSLGLLRYNHTMIKNLYPQPFNEHFRVAGKHFCIHAYTLTRPGAETLIKWQTPVVFNADNLLMHTILNGELKAYIAFPQLFFQRSLDSSSSIASLTGE